MKNDMYELPDTLYDFAQIPNFHTVIEDLANLAEAEDWNYHNQTDPHIPFWRTTCEIRIFALPEKRKLHIRRILSTAALTQGCYRKTSTNLYMHNLRKTQIRMWAAIGIFQSSSEEANMRYKDTHSYQKWHFIGMTQLN